MARIVLVGTGNVGTQLGLRLAVCGHEVVQVFSRSLAKARSLADRLQAIATCSLAELTPQADFYLLAVSDNAIGEVAAAIAPIVGNGIVAHTSGATPSVLLAPFAAHYGVLYPLQTFQNNQLADFDHIPLCVYGGNAYTHARLHTLAQSMGSKLFSVDDAQRQTLHVAAVFVNNFIHHIGFLAAKISTSENIDPAILRPLFDETARKVLGSNAFAQQTGPARRGDTITLDRHREWLAHHHADLLPVYEALTQSIARHYYAPKV